MNCLPIFSALHVIINTFKIIDSFNGPFCVDPNFLIETAFCLLVLRYLVSLEEIWLHGGHCQFQLLFIWKRVNISLQMISRMLSFCLRVVFLDKTYQKIVSIYDFFFNGSPGLDAAKSQACPISLHGRAECVNSHHYHMSTITKLFHKPRYPRHSSRI